MKTNVNILLDLWKMAPSRNVTMIYLSEKPQLLMNNVDFSNRQRLKVS